MSRKRVIVLFSPDTAVIVFGGTDTIAQALAPVRKDRTWGTYYLKRLDL
jgi:hypothetical protein